jgi:hypothetical protein
LRRDRPDYQWYDFVCVYAYANGRIADKKPEYADRAIELLNKAVASGFADSVHAKSDDDLAPLHDRADFEQLIADLEKKSPAKQVK